MHLEVSLVDPMHSTNENSYRAVGHRFGRKIGFRYLWAKKSNRFLSFISAIGIGGVAVGVTTLIVTLSVMSGFERQMREKLFDAETHVLVEPSQEKYLPASSLASIKSEIKASSANVVSAEEVLQTEVILRSGKKVTGAVVKGVSQEYLAWLARFFIESPKTLDDPADVPIFLGQELAFNLGVIPGDFVTAVSPVETDGPLGVVPRVKRFVVAAIYKTGVPDQELHVVFTGVKNVESFLRREGILSHYEVMVKNVDQAPRISSLLKQKLGPGFLIRSWQELNAHLFGSLKLERITMFCILVFIIIVASFNIVSTLMMMVIEKKKSLSILRAIGATPKQISLIFLWQGIAIGLVGLVLGSVFGFGICLFLDRYPIIELPDFFYDRSLPVDFNPWVILAIAAVSLTIVTISAIYPSKKASRLTPIEGLRV
ncbi:MAG: FtsX-like permease family protein [Bacteriovoracia bacterium]